MGATRRGASSYGRGQVTRRGRLCWYCSRVRSATTRRRKRAGTDVVECPAAKKTAGLTRHATGMQGMKKGPLSIVMSQGMCGASTSGGGGNHSTGRWGSMG